jgi:hypothetical protein
MVDGTHSSNSICSKNRVAPLRPTTIPRLELCAAVLLIQLISKLKTTLNLPISKYSYWTDSQIVIAWIKTEPHKLKTFIANRISKIQESSDMSDWSYINTKQNPADILSRGMSPKGLHESHLWWNGPKFLSEHESQ